MEGRRQRRPALGWALVNNPVAERTADGVLLAIGANLAMGLLLALVYARYVEPRLSGASWWRGMQFALVPWLLSLIIFLPLMGGGLLGMNIGAGPLPILGNLILHLVYGAVLGVLTRRRLKTGSMTPMSIASMRRLPSRARPLDWWRDWFLVSSSGG